VPVVLPVEVVPESAVLREAQPRLLLITPPNSYRTAAYLAAARRHAIDVLVASQGRYSLVSELAGGLQVDLGSPAALQQLLDANDRQAFAGVVATDDAVVELGSRVAEALDLPHNPPEAALCSRRKDLSRQVLAGAGVPVPGFRLVRLDRPVRPQIASIDYPCVVKPLALSGSRGVIRADDADALLAAADRVRRILAVEYARESALSMQVLVEDFVPGEEVALEGMLHEGRLAVLAIFDKPDPLNGPYFEETYYITPSRHPAGIRERVIRRIQQACTALGLREGPVHAEVRISDGDGVILEVASRTIGGDCARLLQFGTGQGLEDMVISHAVGKPLPVRPQAGGAGVLMIPIPRAGVLRRVEGITAARAVPCVDDVMISLRDGYELVPLPEGASYLGFMFARAPSAAEAEAALREAHARLNIVVAPLMALRDERGS
jgi:biotin carboxylase